jgi:hypothetical protein
MVARTGLVLAAMAALAVPAAGQAGEAQEGLEELGAPVAAQALDRYRGREDSRLEINIQETSATMEDTVAAHNRSGHNLIGGGSFKDSVGFPMVMQNTGNNVIMQNAVILNIDLK